MPRVTYCEKSTIVEAFAVAAGRPAPIEEGEAVVVARLARKRIPSVRPKETLVAVSVPRDAAPPFWQHQYSWLDGRRLARFGHRYLSVHYLGQATESQRYQTYAASLEPDVATWLDIVANAEDEGRDDHSVDMVAFGYVNQFLFPHEGFDFSRYFNVSLGIRVGDDAMGLERVETGFRFAVRPGVVLHVSVGAESVGVGGQISVQTKVQVERREVEGLQWLDREGVLNVLRETKDTAKDAFFDFATPETHALMGARTDAG